MEEEVKNERNFVEIKSNIWKAEKPGDSVEGVLIAVEHDKGTHNSNMYHLEKNGENISIWGSTVLDDKMGQIKTSDYIKIEYEKSVPNPEGSDLKIFKVYKDENC